MILKKENEMTFESMEAVLKEKFPQYKVSIKTNPLAKFKFVEVKKNGLIGTWVRVFDKKNQVKLINGMPSTAARAALGGLLFIAFAYGPQCKLRKEVAGVLKEKFKTS